ncbi:hypothetical protein BN1088_1431498 [Sphingobacterium sp. PM2-P1-29]|nr:hypothetical protein BN1088_1431498 [Sphingobacterium sp. PM2-P1-29]
MSKATKHQQTIIQFARSNDNKITKKQACELIPFYHNTAKHVGDILSRMVKNKMLIRVKNGSFELNLGQRVNIVQTAISDNPDLNQPRPQLKLGL